MPKKTAPKSTTASEPFSLIPKTTQRAIYDHVRKALQKRNGEDRHNDVAEIAAAIALRSSDVVVAPRGSIGLRLVREKLNARSNAPEGLTTSISAAVESLCSAPSDAVGLVACILGGYKESRHALTFLARTKLPLLMLTRTEFGGRNGTAKSIDLRTVQAEFGIPVITVDANDAIAVYRVVTEAAHNSRVGRGTSIIEAAFVRSTKQGVRSPSSLECLEGYMRRHGAWFRD